MEITEIPVDGHERVARCRDEASGLHALIAVHDTITAEDMSIGISDLGTVRQETRWVTGLARESRSATSTGSACSR